MRLSGGSSAACPAFHRPAAASLALAQSGPAITTVSPPRTRITLSASITLPRRRRPRCSSRVGRRDLHVHDAVGADLRGDAQRERGRHRRRGSPLGERAPQAPRRCASSPAGCSSPGSAAPRCMRTAPNAPIASQQAVEIGHLDARAPVRWRYRRLFATAVQSMAAARSVSATSSTRADNLHLPRGAERDRLDVDADLLQPLGEVGDLDDAGGSIEVDPSRRGEQRLDAGAARRRNPRRPSPSVRR